MHREDVILVSTLQARLTAVSSNTDLEPSSTATVDGGTNGTVSSNDPFNNMRSESDDPFAGQRTEGELGSSQLPARHLRVTVA